MISAESLRNKVIGALLLEEFSESESIEVLSLTHNVDRCYI